MTNAETITKLNSALTTLIKAYEELQKENSSLLGKISELENKFSKLELSNQDLEKEIIQLKGHTEEDKSNLSSILGKIENILNREVKEKKVEDVPAASIFDNSSKNEVKEKVEQNILNLNSNPYENTTQSKNSTKNEDLNKLDLSRMSSLLNGFNN